VSDGTEIGTMLLKDIRPGPDGSYPDALADMGGILYFRADDGTSGSEPWISDGTPVGTLRLKDVNPGAAGSFPLEFAKVGSSVYFDADDGIHGRELWVSDGSEPGTHLAHNIAPGLVGSYPQHLTAGDGVLFFSASDDSLGYELWRADDAGARLVKDISPGPGSSLPEYLVYANGLLHLVPVIPSRKPWTSDGTEEGTVEIQLNATSARDLFAHGDAVYFSAVEDGDDGFELFKTDGSTAYKVSDIEPGPAGSSPLHFASVGDRLFFSASSSANGRELFALVDGGTIGVSDERVSAPPRWGLRVAPNPAASWTAIRFSIVERGTVTLDVFDPSGRRVRRLLHGQLTPGDHYVTWDRRSDAGHMVAPGVYFARLSRAGEVASERIVLSR
jgi:ELWxxDGT repeat protein